MSNLSLKDFANAVGVTYDTAKKHVQRKKIFKGTDGKIDTENPQNVIYINEQTKGSGLFKSSHTVEVKKSSEVKSKKQTDEVTGQTESQKQYLELDYRKRVAEAQLKERENELKRIQLEKMAGNLLPVELVEKILVINIQSIFKNLESEMENMASIYVTDRSILSNVTLKQKELLVKIVEKSKEDSFVEIENAINEYQEVRSRGERR